MLIFRTKILHAFIVFVVLAALAYSLSFFTTFDSSSMVDTEHIEKVIYKKKQRTLQILQQTANQIEKKGFEEYLEHETQPLQALHQNEGIAVVIYKSWYLRFWPDNTVVVPEVYGYNIFEDPFIKLGNKYYVPVHYKMPDYDLVGLIYIKSEFDSSSEMVDDQFNPDFYLSSDIKIVKDPLKEPRVFDEDDNYLFSLQIESKPIQKSAYSWLIFLFFTGALIAFFRLFIMLFRYKRYDSNYYPYLIFSLVFIVVLRMLMVKYQFPFFLYNFDLFSPDLYASNWIAPSLGDLILNTLFALFVFYFAHNAIDPAKILNVKDKKAVYFYLSVFIVLIGAFIIQLNNLLSTVIRDSTIEFQPYKVFNLSGFTLLAFLTIIINIITFLIFVDWGIQYFKKHLRVRPAVWFINGLLILILLLSIFFVPGLSWLSVAFYLLLVNLMLYYRWYNRLKYSFILVFAAASALYLTHVIDVQHNEKQFGRMKLLAVNLSLSQDFYAQMRFQDISEDIPADPYVDTLLAAENENQDELYQYLKRAYFSNYLARYDLQLDVCHDTDSVFVEESPVQWQHCRQYHHRLALEEGEAVFKSNYFYMGEEDSRRQYMGLHDILVSDGTHVTLIVKLKAKIVKYNPGFTQLLDKYRNVGSSLLGSYSYARYNENRLVSKFGDCPYSLVGDPYDQSDDEYSRICNMDYCHLVYKQSPENVIVVSYPTVSFFQLLINFSYLFVFVFLLLSILALYYTYQRKGIVVSNSIRNRIQFSMIGLLLISLIFIGGGSVYYISQGYEKKNMQVINEKLHSVLTEMQTQFANHNSMQQFDVDYLNFLMQKYADVYNSDISVFDMNGNMVSTSRPEVFKQDFLSRKMDFSAFRALKHEHRFKIIQQEQIGKLVYYSAYVPLVNRDNKMLGFVNLPFFSNEDLLTEDISSIIVTFINVYVLLILLTIIIAVFISNNVTRPLQLLRQKMRQVDIKKHNEPIDLKTDDEVGDLVREYNHMVSELTRSVELLARQERETAWRSMARQVAHEIKNPLTPMKLSVQLMLRAWQEKAPDFEQRLVKVSNTLIHQIETLSNIATEFSTFARMPNEQIEKVEVNTIIKSASALYDEYKDIEIEVDLDQSRNFNVMADKSRLLRMLNNLIKNAAQAIPKDRKGLVTMSSQQVGDMVLIKVTDNGDGIPEEIRGKLFQPNFTTKTKGMGLGLAMVKNIVEGFGGKIWFDTETGEGTTFFIQLPLV
ncbi:MAG TPA: ATP-binding protein [Salinivirga sp.]|uniref:sensor histidine kinase n=1 Tax=Salinivirga sp. TaxID=1970192 RepID=UPI002B46855E|nr:ATP-binding protein [Salinivirga sp.]HKK60577.1 ATP-binding protein [Salinivirga sp.]